jgi:hypothetical protein
MRPILFIFHIKLKTHLDKQLIHSTINLKVTDIKLQ